tara:strand:+ start:3501 stop:4763 length:1263 start_codon:yes stop_codon:yes gene_type:complete
MKDLINKMKKLNENKNAKVVTFDFDNTIVKSFENSNDDVEIQYQFGGLNKKIISKLKKFKEAGVTVFVVTSRNVDLEVPESSVRTMLDQLKLDVDGIFYTNGDTKAKKLYELGSSMHWDDDPKEHEAIKAYGNLHKDFNITVKYPDELLSDIEVISKGIIMTNDNRFVIAQRSDSLEWDAPGGHLMEGEEAPYAFWREVKEELALEVRGVEYLGSKDTVWQKKDKLVHYFLAMVPYSCEELKGIVKLQWEVEDYFCGTLDQVIDKMSSREGATQNLKNVINFISEDENLLLEMEKYQKQVRKGYNNQKKKIVDTGLNKYKTSGMKNLSLPRSKSAPVGFGGALEEENDKKKEKKIKIRFVYDIDEKKKRKKRRKGKKPGPKKGSRRKKRTNKYHWGVGSWWYGGGYGDSNDGGGDGGGGE